MPKLNKLINIFLLVVFVSHLTFAHEFVAEYVICTDSEGTVSIQKCYDCTDCSTSGSQQNISSTNSVKQDCDDVHLGENCFEHEQFLHKDKVIITTFITGFVFIPEIITPHYQNYSENKHTRLKNIQLDNFTTVLLLI